MFLNGKESKSDLRNKCSCQSCSGSAIVMEGQCLVAHMEDQCGGKTLCLGDLNIPISCAVAATKTIPSGGILNIDDCFCSNSFVGILVKDNKSLHYRTLDKLSDNLNTVNYDFDINITTTDIGLDKVGVLVDINLAPDNTTYIATWDNIDTIYINGEPFIQWSEANLSWFSLGSANISNILNFPTLNGQISGVMINDGNGNFPPVIIRGNIKDNTINYYVEIELSYDYNTTTFNYEILKVELQLEEFLDDNIIIQQKDVTAVKATGGFNITCGGYPFVGFQAGDSFNINGVIFTEGIEFNIGADDAATADSLIAAINGNVVINTILIATHDYILGSNGGGKIILTSLNFGTTGNSITTSINNGVNTAIDATLTGGIDFVSANNIDITAGIVTINMVGKFKTIAAKRYKTLNSVLINSSKSGVKLDDIELYNNNDSDIVVCLLTAG